MYERKDIPSMNPEMYRSPAKVLDSDELSRVRRRLCDLLQSDDAVRLLATLDAAYRDGREAEDCLRGREAVLRECLNRLGQYIGMCRCPGKACVEACDECDKTQAIINGAHSLLALGRRVRAKEG
jgi:hypothetical protein